jgi:AraC-like DNA-binding protein
LHLPLARVDAQLDHTFWAAAERVACDPAIGLTIGREQARNRPRFVDVYIALHSGTLRKIHENVERFAKLSDDRSRVQLHEAGTLATFRYYRDGGYPRAHAYMDQLFAHGICSFRQHVPGFRLTEMRLRRPAPNDAAPYLETFEVMPHFSSVLDEFSFDRALLDVPMVGSDAQLAEILKDHAAELVRKTPAIDPWLYSVQKALYDGLECGQLGLSTIARATGTSTRTLRRKLSDLGTSFHEELDKLRYELASQELRTGQASMTEVAERLGFTSTRTFQRAFRRWTGLTPSAYRQRQRGQNDWTSASSPIPPRRVRPPHELRSGKRF